MKNKEKLNELDRNNQEQWERGYNKALNEVEEKLYKWMTSWEKQDISISQYEFLLRRIRELREK